MNDSIKTMIEKYEVKGDFTHTAITDAQISEAESILSVKLPSQYTEFLRTYGHGGIGGTEIIGIGKNGKLLFVDATLRYREYGLPQNLVVIENCDEWVCCIDCSSGKVVTWSEDIPEEAYSDFDTYLLDRFKDAAENL